MAAPRYPITVTPDQRLLLRAALDQPEQALRCFSQWWDHVDIEHTGTTEYRLLPLVHANIGRLISDKAAAARVRGVAKHVWLSNSKSIVIGAHAIDRLTQAGIPTLILKGSAMLAGVSAENLRSIGDCDILVPAERAREALAALVEAGLRAPQAVRRFSAYDYQTFHGLSLSRTGEQPYHLDIHWRPLREVGADALTNEFFDQSVPCQISGRDTRRPCFEHMLLQAAVHGTAWAEVSRYDWLADAALILRTAGTEFDWDRLLDTADRYLLGSIIGIALSEITQTLEIPIPASALQPRPRRGILERAESHWRRKDPANSRLGRGLVELQTTRRSKQELLGRSALAVVPEIWRSVFGPPPHNQMQTATEVTAEDNIIYLRGWSFAEPTGRWTDGRLATLAIQRARGEKEDVLRLAGSLFKVAPDQSQTIDIYSGWRRLARLTSQNGSWAPFAIKLPPALRKSETLTLQLHIHKPMVPVDTGQNTDIRQLGLFLQDMRVSPCARDAVTKPIDLRLGTDDLTVLWSGWSSPESEGCWTDGSKACLRWIAPHDLPPGARLVMRGFGFSGQEPLRVSISINDRDAGDVSQLAAASAMTELSMRLEPNPGARSVNIDIHIENPQSPREAGHSSDERKLGLFLQSVRIEAGQRAQSSAVLSNGAASDLQPH